MRMWPLSNRYPELKLAKMEGESEAEFHRCSSCSAKPSFQYPAFCWRHTCTIWCRKRLFLQLVVHYCSKISSQTYAPRAKIDTFYTNPITTEIYWLAFAIRLILEICTFAWLNGIIGCILEGKGIFIFVCRRSHSERTVFLRFACFGLEE